MDFAQIRQEEKRVAAVVRRRDAILDAMHLCDLTIADFEKEIDELQNNLRLFKNDLRLRSAIPFIDKTKTTNSINQIQEDIARLRGKIDQENDKLDMFEVQLLDYAQADDYVAAVWQQKEAYVAQFEPAKSILAEAAKLVAAYEEQLPLLQELFKRVSELANFLEEHHHIFFTVNPRDDSVGSASGWPVGNVGGILRSVELGRARKFLREHTDSYVLYIHQNSYLSGLMSGHPVKSLASGLRKPDNVPLAETNVDMVRVQRRFIQRKHEVLQQNIAIEKQQSSALVYRDWKRICEEKESSLNPKELISKFKVN